jgi:hypothetical protein
LNCAEKSASFCAPIAIFLSVKLIVIGAQFDSFYFAIALPSRNKLQATINWLTDDFG